jgi:hypothetical protein
MTDTPYTKRLDQIQEARKRFNESEWRLSFLRVIEPEQPQPTPDQLLEWNQNLLRGLN